MARARPPQCASFHGVEEGLDHQSAFPLGDSWSNHIGDLLNEVRLGHSLLRARSVAKSCRLLYRNLHGGFGVQVRPAADTESDCRETTWDETKLYWTTGQRPGERHRSMGFRYPLRKG